LGSLSPSEPGVYAEGLRPKDGFGEGQNVRGWRNAEGDGPNGIASTAAWTPTVIAIMKTKKSTGKPARVFVSMIKTSAGPLPTAVQARWTSLRRQLLVADEDVIKAVESAIAKATGSRRCPRWSLHVAETQRQAGMLEKAWPR
jgi:hypothetical protein